MPGVSLTCVPAGGPVPGGEHRCTGGLTTTGGADVTRTATVTWDAESATSAPVTVTWVPVRAFTVALASDIADFDTVGTVITYTATVTNPATRAMLLTRSPLRASP